MRIGVLSDTHLQKEDIREKSPMYQRFWTIVNSAFRQVDYILHAGDILHFEVIKVLQQFAPVTWVGGNGDDIRDIRNDQQVVQMEWEGIKVVMAHKRPLLYPFATQGVKVFIYGHSHIASIEENEDHQLWINPGSIRRPMGAGGQPSVALLTLQKGVYSAKLWKPEDPI